MSLVMLGGCEFSTMEWYCCLSKGHKGDHTSSPLIGAKQSPQKKKKKGKKKNEQDK